MSGYLLIRANNLYGSYVESQTPPLMQAKGAVIEARHTDDGFGAAEVLPAIARIKVSDGTVEDLELYQMQWYKSLDWSIISNDPVADAYRLNISATNPGNGDGNTSFAELQEALNSWGAVLVTEGANSVIVDMTVFGAISSEGFWDRAAVGAFSFTELNYDQGTGVHTIQADYSTINLRASGVDKLVRRKGGVIISHEAKIITFTIQRSVAVQEFKSDLKSLSEKQVRVNRYRITTATVDAAIAGGGVTTVTLAALQAGIIDDSI